MKSTFVIPFPFKILLPNGNEKPTEIKHHKQLQKLLFYLSREQEMSQTADDSMNVVIEDVNAFITQSERTVGSFVRNRNIVAGFKAMKRYSKTDVFKANCFNSAIEHVLFKKRAMSSEEQSVLVIRFLIDKNTQENWIGDVGTNVKSQDGYDTIQKAVKEMKDITVRYFTDYDKNPFLGKIPYGTVKKYFMSSMEPDEGSAYEPSIAEMGVFESLSTERAGYIIAAHQARMLFDVTRKTGSGVKGSAHPTWLEEMNDAYLARNFKVGKAGSKFVDNTYKPPRLMLTFIAVRDCNFNETRPLRFLYTGDIVTDPRFGAGYVDQFGFEIEHNIWVVPRNDFDVTNEDYLHPVHLIHQESGVAHFIIVRKHRMVWIEQVRGWKKDEPLFLCYDDMYVAKVLKEKFIELENMSSSKELQTIHDECFDDTGNDPDYVGDEQSRADGSGDDPHYLQTL